MLIFHELCNGLCAGVRARQQAAQKPSSGKTSVASEFLCVILCEWSFKFCMTITLQFITGLMILTLFQGHDCVKNIATYCVCKFLGMCSLTHIWQPLDMRLYLDCINTGICVCKEYSGCHSQLETHVLMTLEYFAITEVCIHNHFYFERYELPFPV